MVGAVRGVMVVGAAALVLASCSDDEPATASVPSVAAETTTAPAMETSIPPSTTTTAVPPEPDPSEPDIAEVETTARPTEPTEPTDPDATVPSESTAPGSTAPPTSPPPESTTTTTTEPLHMQELILHSDGIGSAMFGADPDGVLDYVTSVLGGNTGDTGWVDPLSFADCGAGGVATRARRVDWGVLSLLFSDGSDYATERDHFIGYEYGRVGQIGDEPIGLHTEGFVGLGSRVIDVFAEFPEATVNEGDEDVGIPPNFYVSNYFYGLLTGIDDDDVVTVIFGGYGCGE